MRPVGPVCCLLAVIGCGGPEATPRPPFLPASAAIENQGDLLSGWARDLHSPDEGKRQEARSALARCGKEAVPFLVQALDGADLVARVEAVEALAEMPEAPRDAAVPSLVTAAQSPNPQLRDRAIVALGSIGPSARAAIPVIKLSWKDENEDIVRHAQAALDRIQGRG